MQKSQIAPLTRSFGRTGVYEPRVPPFTSMARSRQAAIESGIAMAKAQTHTAGPQVASMEGTSGEEDMAATPIPSLEDKMRNLRQS